MSALASPCSAVLPLPALPPPLSPALSSLAVAAGAQKICVGTEVVFKAKSASIRSRREPTPVRGLTCFRKRLTVALGETVRYPPLVMTSLLPAPSSTGAGARLGSRSFLRPQLGHCGRAAT